MGDEADYQLSKLENRKCGYGNKSRQHHVRKLKPQQMFKKKLTVEQMFGKQHNKVSN